MSFQVYDEKGRIWPPHFESELMKPGGRFSMLSRQAEAMAVLSAKGAKARAEGKGWGSGTLEHLVKPLLPQAKRVRVG
jgi:hypothetical protein